MTNIQYAYWREDKPAEPGFSKELISVYSDKTQLDSLNLWPRKPDGTPLKTLTQALLCLEERAPNSPYFGTKVQTGTSPEGKPIFEYQWMTVKEVADLSRKFGAGLVAMNLIPEVEGEGRKWRMLGI